MESLVEKGDVVRSVKMTIESVEGDQIICVWFEDGELHRQTFRRSFLILEPQ